MIALIQGLNFVQSFVGLMLLTLIALHLLWGLRFSARQERQALTLLWFYIFFVASGHAMTGVLASAPNLEEATRSLPPLAYVYIFVKAGTLITKITMVLWVLVAFWPTQSRAP